MLFDITSNYQSSNTILKQSSITTPDELSTNIPNQGKIAFLNQSSSNYSNPSETTLRRWSLEGYRHRSLLGFWLNKQSEYDLLGLSATWRSKELDGLRTQRRKLPRNPEPVHVQLGTINCVCLPCVDVELQWPNDQSKCTNAGNTDFDS